MVPSTRIVVIADRSAAYERSTPHQELGDALRAALSLLDDAGDLVNVGADLSAEEPDWAGWGTLRRERPLNLRERAHGRERYNQAPLIDADGNVVTLAQDMRDHLVYVAHPGRPSKDVEDEIDDFLDGAPGQRSAFGVLPHRAAHDVALPEKMRSANAVSWTSSIDEAGDDVLAAAGLAPQSRTAFISYSRHDAGKARQLHDALRARRFTVFLDTYDIAPGVVFEPVLYDAIVEQGLLVLLESLASAMSRWVTEELAEAQRQRAALVGVTIDQRGTSPAIPAAWRTPWTTADQVATFVVRQHRVQSMLRREALARALHHALDLQHLRPSVQSFGCLSTAGPVGTELRPPTPREFRVLDHVRANGGYKRAGIVAPQSTLPAKRLDVEWLSRSSVIRMYPEGLINVVGPDFAAP
jgi:hypothetical protein